MQWGRDASFFQEKKKKKEFWQRKTAGVLAGTWDHSQAETRGAAIPAEPSVGTERSGTPWKEQGVGARGQCWRHLEGRAPCSELPHGPQESLSEPSEVQSREQQGPLTHHTPPLHVGPAHREEKVEPLGGGWLRLRRSRCRGT